MQLYIDPTGGIAGDMFSAALISAGADESKMLYALTTAGNAIGQSQITTETTHDGATRLKMHIHHNHGHLGASKARKLIHELCVELEIEEEYAEFANRALEVLIAAEKQAHEENTFLTDHHHHSHDHHDHEHHHQDHDHHHHHEHEEAWLHEAQDIIIDIIGAAYGLQLLAAPTTATLIKPVSLGGGRIKFSHGEMPVPAPATKIIMDKYEICHQMGPLNIELCTPTGSSVLAALGVKECVDVQVNGVSFVGKSRGGKDLDIPPLTIYLK